MLFADTIKIDGVVAFTPEELEHLKSNGGY